MYQPRRFLAKQRINAYYTATTFHVRYSSLLQNLQTIFTQKFLMKGQHTSYSQYNAPFFPSKKSMAKKEPYILHFHTKQNLCVGTKQFTIQQK